jgi:hypothetical protein
MSKWPVVLILLTSFLSSVLAQTSGARFALLIGNGNYGELARLRNPANDAADIATALKGVHENPTAELMHGNRNFLSRLANIAS